MDETSSWQTATADELGLPVASLWTPRGRGAIAVLRVQGDVRSESLWGAIPFSAANGRLLNLQPYGRIVYGHWGQQCAEQVVVCLIDPQTLEIHCHGGEAAAARILDDLSRAGCTIVSWQQAAARTQGVLEAEILNELAKATTLRCAEILLEQQSGALRASLNSFAGERNCARMVATLAELRRWVRFGLHLTRPWKVVFSGCPNVGKSSLINALLGYTRSVVFDRPGTTRDIVTALTSIDGWPIELSDTAGIRTSADPLEAAGVKRALESLAAADLPVILIDASVPQSEDDRKLIDGFPNAIVVAHKCDLALFAESEDWNNGNEQKWIRVSSKTGEGVDSLLRALVDRLLPEIPPAGTAIPVTARQTACLEHAHEAALRGDLVNCHAAIDELLR